MWDVWLKSCLNEDQCGSEANNVREDFLLQQSVHENNSETKEFDQDDAQNDVWKSDNEMPLSQTDFFHRKKKYECAKTVSSQLVQTPAHNIIQSLQISS